MGKYLKNGVAYIRGLLLSAISLLDKNRTVESRVRVFVSASLSFDKGAKVHIAERVKVRERAVISVRKNGILKLSKNVSVGMDCKIAVHEHVEIGEGTLLSPNVLIYDHDHVFDSVTGVHRKEFISKPVIIGKNCWIGANTVILRGTTLGDNCVVGAGSVIRGSFDSNSVIVQKRDTSISQFNG